MEHDNCGSALVKEHWLDTQLSELNLNRDQVEILVIDNENLLRAHFAAEGVRSQVFRHFSALGLVPAGHLKQILIPRHLG